MQTIIPLDDIKIIELQILIDIHQFCESHNITYYLGYGTLLGAKRHSGFIPWDDDIDILMPRAEYERFINLYSSECYEVAVVGKNDYYYPYAKVFDTHTKLLENSLVQLDLGIYVDVFPLDGVSNNLLLRKIQNLEILFLKRLLTHKYSPYNRKRNVIKKMLLPIVKFVLSPISCQYLGYKLDQVSKRYSYEESEMVGCLTEDAEKDIVFNKNIFNPSSSIPFERHVFFAPHDIEKYLTLLYGDYMVLPPIEKRTNTHSFKAYYK